MGNELTIRVCTGEGSDVDDELTDKILEVLRDAEEEGILVFPFDVIRNRYPR